MCGICGELRFDLRVALHRQQRAGDAIDGRLVTRVQKEDAIGDQFVVAESLARFFHGNERRDQIVSRIGAALIG